jgi:toxin ParE1/3/4
MKELVYSPLAEADLGEIWDYTAHRWDADQADACVAMIANTALNLARGMTPGQSIDWLRAGYRRRLAGSHAIFYRETESTIIVVRVLHQRMDVPDLPDEG